MIQRLEPGNLSTRVYSTLREALISGAFGPGQRLVLQDLADKLGTSVTPVREACLRLVSERGLEMRSGRFVTVPALDLPRYLEIRTIRIALEGLAAERAAEHATPEDIGHLRAIQTKFEAARNAGDATTANRLNRDFHFGVYRLSRLEMLVAQIESLWVSMGPILKVYHEDIPPDYLIADEHIHLIEALERRDGPKARRAMEQDILRGGEGIVAYLTKSAAGTEPLKAASR
ncbi:GntR family transcriptional regulator [Rhodoligotrophos defluvii]|uniref:GntR family transcriptional regulator n=1 Tax=Rhodoligotrophos defluvii TaxID=2561934 RepID=UPI0010C986FC|nr:GntR family transcriptional regulator [Rhodoligotrophos defluvii]